MLIVTVTDKNGLQSTLPIKKDEIRIGRIAGNDVVLPSSNVSKRHAQIVFKNGQLILLDLKSSSGTYFNGTRINAPVSINKGDNFMIDEYTLEVY